jgi:hypothetical protein
MKTKMTLVRIIHSGIIWVKIWIFGDFPVAAMEVKIEKPGGC